MIRSTPPLPILDSKNYNRIIHQWNDTNRDYLNNKTIDELFCAQAEETPDNIALVYEGKELSYKELNEKSNQLARRIRALYKQKTYQAMAPGTLIGLCLDRSLELMVGMLAILKAGGAYVPIDLAYPQERINYLLDDTNVELILSQNHYGGDNEIQLPSDKMVYIDLSESLYRNESKLNLPLYCHATDLAYVIYTSGTTGRPKGVMVEHHAVINYVNNIGDIFLKGVSSVDFSTNLAFDLSPPP